MIFDRLDQIDLLLEDRTVVVGSGAVGLYIAVHLARRGENVLVIEGGNAQLGGFSARSYQSVGHRHQGIDEGRSRTLGGTTNLWGGQLAEFQPIDFEERPGFPGSKWPLSYEEIAGYYPATYGNLGVDADSQKDAAVWKAVLGAAPEFPEGVEVFLTRWMKIPNFALLYGGAIEGGDGPGVLLGHTVIGFEGKGSQIDGVKVRGATGKAATIRAKCVILAAGTMEISRLMLHSAEDPQWTCPWRGNPNIGAYFQDHFGGRVAYVHPTEPRIFFKIFSTIVLGGQKFQPKLRLADQVVRGENLLNVQAMLSFESSVSENLVFLKQFLKAAIYRQKVTALGDLFRNLVACGKYLAPLMWRYVVEHRVFVPSSSRISLFVQSEQIPLAASRLSIDPERRDEAGLPAVVLDWKWEGSEGRRVREFTERIDRAFRTMGLGRLEIVPEMRVGAEAMEMFHDTYHQAGGARMGFSAEDGVVDHDLRVFGTENLYIGGAATFRTCSNANTTFTALALATRLVDHLTAGAGPK